jgi:hypothetical protein
VDEARPRQKLGIDALSIGSGIFGCFREELGEEHRAMERSHSTPKNSVSTTLPIFLMEKEISKEGKKGTESKEGKECIINFYTSFTFFTFFTFLTFVLTDPNPDHRDPCTKYDARKHFEQRMSERFLETMEMLHHIENLRLFAQCPPDPDRVVPHDAGEDRSNGELHGIHADLPAHDDEERCDECGVRARHASLMEQTSGQVSRPQVFHPIFHNLRDAEHHQRDQEKIRAKEIGDKRHMDEV